MVVCNAPPMFGVGYSADEYISKGFPVCTADKPLRSFRGILQRMYQEYKQLQLLTSLFLVCIFDDSVTKEAKTIGTL